MPAPRRANPRQTLDAILDAADYDAALAKLTGALRRTWGSGYDAGWEDGVADTTVDDPSYHENPYPLCGATRPGTLGYQKCVRDPGHGRKHRSQDRGEW